MQMRLVGASPGPIAAAMSDVGGYIFGGTTEIQKEIIARGLGL